MLKLFWQINEISIALEGSFVTNGITHVASLYSLYFVSTLSVLFFKVTATENVFIMICSLKSPLISMKNNDVTWRTCLEEEDLKCVA